MASAPHRSIERSNASPDSLIRVRNLSTTFSSEVVLDGVEFDIKRGEFVCLLGPSGCGKSTTLRILGNLLVGYEGEVTVDGLPPSQAWSKLAYVFQSPRLVPWRTALGNVALGLELRHSKAIAAQRIDHCRAMLEMVGLAADVEKYPAILSGGERQRVAIARALAVDPEIILMDEPLSALDVKTKQQLRGEILRIWTETKSTIVYVTHDVEEALILADRIVVFSNKPTSILSIHELESDRPRNVSNDPALHGIGQEILRGFGANVTELE